MLYATATLASMKAARGEGKWSQSRTQELAAARSATARLVAEFNRAGDLEESVFEGEIHGLPYQAQLRADPDNPDIFHLNAVVGNSNFTRVIRQEPRSLHTAFARTGLVTNPTLWLQTSLSGGWESIPEPPSQDGDLARIPAIAANSNGECFAFRFGTRLYDRVPTPFLSKFDVQTQSWTDLPPIPYDFRESLRESDGWDIETYARQSVLAANKKAVFTVLGPNLLHSQRAPRDVAKLYIFDQRNDRWHEAPQPAIATYDSQGELRFEQEEISIGQLVANDEMFLMELTGSDPVSTIVKFENGGWSRLPPLPGSGKADSIACGPRGTVSAVIRNPEGEPTVVRLADGSWYGSELPTDHDGVHMVSIDSSGRDWIQDMQNERWFRSLKEGWEEKVLPDAFNREVDVGARADDELHYYQTTTGY